jgi:hypothetical protein
MTKKMQDETKKQSVVVKKTQKERDIEKEVREYRLDPQVRMEREIVKKGEAIEKMGGQDFQDTANRIKDGLDVAEKMAEVKRKKVRFKKPQGK